MVSEIDYFGSGTANGAQRNDGDEEGSDTGGSREKSKRKRKGEEEEGDVRSKKKTTTDNQVEGKRGKDFQVFSCNTFT